jgi:DNA-binding transcriptional MerR regulator
MARTYTIRQFAGIAGVSVRTLHHYDRIGLLSPERSASGYRTYHEHDLEVLEQIVALRFIGIPLKQIKTLLHRDPQEFVRALAAQRISLGEKGRSSTRAFAQSIKRNEASRQEGLLMQPHSPTSSRCSRCRTTMRPRSIRRCLM